MPSGSVAGNTLLLGAGSGYALWQNIQLKAIDAGNPVDSACQTRAHRPISAVLAVPTDGHLDQMVVRRAVQIGTGVIAGTHYVVDPHLDRVLFFAVSDLMALLVPLPLRSTIV
jgi:hypothetical protein